MSKKSEPISEGRLHEMQKIVTRRPNGRLRVQQDFQFCPTMTEQHSAQMTDLNYLIEKYRPDELAQYIQAKNNMRREIIGHDFSKEPTLQEAKNVVYELRQNFEKLPDEIKNSFRNHVEFLKFIDNPQNQDKMIKLGLLKQKEIEKLVTPGTTTTQEAKEPKEPK